MKSSLVAIALLAVTGCSTPYGEAEEERSAIAITEPAPAPAPKKDATKETIAATSTASTGSASHDTSSDKATTALDFTWHEVSPTAEYSLDAMLTNGEMVGPCIGAPVLGRQLSLSGFTGTCTSAERTLVLSTIQDFRICYAENDDWANCKCKLANWDGKSTSITFDN